MAGGTWRSHRAKRGAIHREWGSAATETSNMMFEWRVDYSIVRGHAQGSPGRMLVVGDDERQARSAALEAVADLHEEIEITGIAPF